MASMAAQPSMSPQIVQFLLNSSGELPPPGETSNFNAPQTLHAYFNPTLVLGIAFSTVLLIARIYTKARVLRHVGWEDYHLLIGWAFFIAFCSFCFLGERYVGIHMWDERVKDIFKLLYYANMVEILYGPSIAFVKVSILLQYFRIFVPSRRLNPAMFYGIHIVLWSNVVFFIITTFFNIFACTPREAIWNKLVSGSCYNVNATLLSTAICNLISDIVIVVLPQYSIWRLQIPWRHKLGVSAIFGLGFLACVVTALRVQSSLQIIQTLDFSWYVGPLALWAVAEMTLAIICSCLPIMPKFVQAMRHGLSSQTPSKETPWYGSRISTSTATTERKHAPVERAEASHYAHWNRTPALGHRDIEGYPEGRGSIEGFQDDDIERTRYTASSRYSPVPAPPPIAGFTRRESGIMRVIQTDVSVSDPQRHIAQCID